MPQMGVSVAEGTLVEWRKQRGDWIEADETICEISTDKIDTEVPSPATEMISTVPSKARTRSRMPSTPVPPRSALAPPTPSSETVIYNCPLSSPTATSTRVARECLAALVRASVMRK